MPSWCGCNGEDLYCNSCWFESHNCGVGCIECGDGAKYCSAGCDEDHECENDTEHSCIVCENSEGKYVHPDCISSYLTNQSKKEMESEAS